jgi:hypothetical protein
MGINKTFNTRSSETVFFSSSLDVHKKRRVNKQENKSEVGRLEGKLNVYGPDYPLHFR